MEGIVEVMADGLAAQGHDLGYFLDIGLHIIPEVNDLLLAAGEGGEHFTELAGQVGVLFVADQGVLRQRGAAGQVVEGGFDPAPGAVEGAGEVVTEGFEQVVFDKGGLADGKTVDPEGQEEVLDAILYQLPVPGKAGSVSIEIRIMGAHELAEGVHLAVAESAPELEIFI
jgi:hypothetical protein